VAIDELPEFPLAGHDNANDKVVPVRVYVVLSRCYLAPESRPRFRANLAIVGQVMLGLEAGNRVVGALCAPFLR